MSVGSDCCDTNDRTPRQAVCPVTGTTGTRVRLQTVKAILSESGLRRLMPRTYYFCPEPDCSVVYFSEQDDCYSTDDLRTTVWQKEPAGSRLLCYCFGENEQTIAAEIAATGTSNAMDRVKEHVRSGRCACDVRNPRGVCCLADLRAAIARLGDAAEVLRMKLTNSRGASCPITDIVPTIVPAAAGQNAASRANSSQVDRI